MAYNPIDHGIVPGDNTGEVTFISWSKANAMFEELFNRVAEIDIYPFVKVGTSLIKKEGANVDRTIMEVGDTTIWKEINNSGDPLVLIGHTYLGGDQELESSYELEKTISS